MKRMLSGIAASIISLGVLCGCQKEMLPVPEYPLDMNTVAEALEEWGVSCTIEEIENSPERENQTLYMMTSNENNWIFADINNGKIDEERILTVGFDIFRTNHNMMNAVSNAILLEDCEDAIVFATHLFGGFESSHVVYETFIKDYDGVNTVRTQYDTSEGYFSEERAVWECEINGIACQITINRPRLDRPEEYLGGIRFCTDWELFFPAE